MHNIRRISLCLPKKLWIVYNLGKNVLKTQSEVTCGKYQKSRALDKKGGNCLQFPRKLMLELSQRCTSPLMFYLGMFQNFLSCFMHIILQGITVFRNQAVFESDWDQLDYWNECFSPKLSVNHGKGTRYTDCCCRHSISYVQAVDYDPCLSAWSTW